VVRSIRVEPALHRARGDLQRTPTGSHLHGFKVEPVGRARRDQRLYFGDDFAVKDFFEPPFFAASSEATVESPSIVSAHSSHTFQ